MADEKKISAPPSTKKTPEPVKAKVPSKVEGSNGKGDAPRNCFSEDYRSNFDGIDWSK